MNAPAIFSPEQLKKFVEDHSVNVPKDHKNAIVGSVDNTGAQAIVTMRRGDRNQWLISGAFQHTWSGDNRVGGEVIYSW